MTTKLSEVQEAKKARSRLKFTNSEGQQPSGTRKASAPAQPGKPGTAGTVLSGKLRHAVDNSNEDQNTAVSAGLGQGNIACQLADF